jgi:hypothetical protein
MVPFWCSTHQPTVESSVLGDEFVVPKNGIETQLRMMDLPLSGPTYMYGDNMSALNNIQRPEFVFKKKLNLMCYHDVCESGAQKQ